jgi:signal transduction histidine kinase/CheY-like chemotaxis protein
VVFCVDALRSEADLQAELNERSGWLRELQAAQRSIQTHGPRDPAVAEALARVEAVADEALLDSYLAGPAAEAGEAASRLRRALADDDARDEARVTLVHTVDELSRSIWEENDVLAGDSDRLWRQIQIVAFCAIAMAAAALFLWVVVHRRGLAALALSQRLTEALEEAEASRARAEAGSRAKSEFVATISHEIRTPMTAILGAADLMRAGAIDPLQARHLAIIDKAGDALLQLVDDVLDLARIEAGRLELERQDFDMGRLVQEAALLFEGRARAKGLNLRVEGDPSGRVEGDPVRLRQVLVNLVGNALKFTGDGEVVLAVERNGDLVLFEVLDTGPGLPAGFEEQVFGAFTQVDSSSSRLHGGAGLGLAIARRLVEAMGGEISASTRLAGGACFRFEVPLPLQEIQASEPSGPLMYQTGEFSLDAGPMILLVDDNADTRQVIGMLLRTIGYRVDTAEDGRVALERTAEQDYDLVLMDCDMPIQDGWTTTMLLREQGTATANSPVLGLSGHATSEAAERGREAGMDDHLHKPIRLEQLKAAVDGWLRTGRRASAEARGDSA